MLWRTNKGWDRCLYNLVQTYLSMTPILPLLHASEGKRAIVVWLHFGDTRMALRCRAISLFWTALDARARAGHFDPLVIIGVFGAASILYSRGRTGRMQTQKGKSTLNRFVHFDPAETGWDYLRLLSWGHSFCSHPVTCSLGHRGSLHEITWITCASHIHWLMRLQGFMPWQVLTCWSLLFFVQAFIIFNFLKVPYISPIFQDNFQHGEMEVLDTALSYNLTCSFVSEGLQWRRRRRLGPISVWTSDQSTLQASPAQMDLFEWICIICTYLIIFDHIWSYLHSSWARTVYSCFFTLVCSFVCSLRVLRTSTWWYVAVHAVSETECSLTLVAYGMNRQVFRCIM